MLWVSLATHYLMACYLLCAAAPLPAAEDSYIDDDYKMSTDEELDLSTAESSGSVFHSIWLNPCNDELHVKVGQGDGTELPVAEAVETALLEVRIALRYSRQLLKELAMTAFRENLPEALHSCSHIQYDWLAVDLIKHKEVGKNLSPESLHKLQWDTTLNDSYTALQKVAVAMEQIFRDQAVDRSDYFSQPRRNELRLRTVLCSVQSVMLDLGSLQKSDIARHLVVQTLRGIGKFSTGNLRDFIILREYTNVLEYTLQVLEHFQNSS